MPSPTSYHWIIAPKRLTVNIIFKNYLRKKSLIFLAGSGISLDPPSNLPTGYQITQKILQELIPVKYQELVLSLMNPDRPHKQNPGDFIRFEQLMGKLVETKIDPNFSILEEIGLCNKPNANHFILAELLRLRQGHKIFTTNFDSLIEYALKALKVKKQNIRPIVYEDEWNDSEYNDNHLSIYKLHGSFINIITNKDTRDSLETTLEQIAKEKENVFSLEEWKQRDFQRFLQTNPVIVIGYSGTDDFDVIPALRTVKSNQYLIWINHQRNITVKNAVIEIIKEGKEIISSNQRVSSQLIQLAQNNTRQAKKLILITIDTKLFLEYVCNCYSTNDNIYIQNTFNGSNIFNIPSYVNDIPESVKWSLSGQLLMDRSEFSDAYQCFTIAIDYATKEGDIKGKSADLANMGTIREIQGHTDEALDFYGQALTINRQLGDLKNEGAILTNIGIICDIQGHTDEALKCFRESLAIANNLNDFKGMASILTNIGATLYNQGRVDEAMDHYQEALAIDQQIGDLEGKSRDLNNIGMLFEDRGQVGKALDHYQEAFDIDQQIGNLKGKSRDLNNIGVLYYNQGRLDEALNHYQEALDIEEQIGDLKGQAIKLTNIGLIQSSKGLNNEAFDYYQRALAIDEQIGDKKNKITDLYNIGAIYFNQGRLDEALKYYQQALVIAEQLNDLSMIQNIKDKISYVKR